jgi:hypothetical protein
MDLWPIITTVIGAALNFYAAWWLVKSSNPTDPRYTDDGMLYPGQQRSAVVPNLVRDQRRIGAVVAVGNTFLLVGATLAWLGH